MKTNKKPAKPNNYRYDFENNDVFLEQLKSFQNDINSQYKTSKIAVTSISEDELAYKFAIALAKSYDLNDSKTLVIDANFYSFFAEFNKKESVTKVDGVSVLRVKDENYPGDYFRNGGLGKITKEFKDDYDRFIILTPDIKKHKEIGLLSDFVDCSLILVRKNHTRKEDVFNAVEYCKDKQLPVAKIIILK